MFDPQVVRLDFPVLARQVHGKPLVYLDNAATSHKPRVVLKAMTDFYEHSNANVHRGVHVLSDESTQAWSDARQVVAEFLGADRQELIVTRNTTEGVNGVAYGWADHTIKAGDEIIVTLMDHHSNLVVWQEVAKRTGASIQFLQLNDEGTINLDDLPNKVTAKTKLVALPHVSNTLGTVNPVSEISQLVKKLSHGQARLLVDGAQAVPHMPVSFHTLGVDFYVFSGHKMLGPMGVGGILVRKELLDTNEMRPWLFGGGMIDEVYPDHTTFQDDPEERFTAGTPDVASLVGLAQACTYLKNLGMENVHQHDRSLVEYALEKLSRIPEITIIGPRVQRLGSVAFIYQGVHAHDVAQILDSEGVAVRSGHHCTMPLHMKFGWQATVRASFQIYNTTDDIDVLITALSKVKTVFGS